MSDNSDPKKLEAMHVSELYRLVTDGSRAALSELMSRQQNGRGLRYYPDGRESIEDDGIITVWIEAVDGAVQIRSGRPNKRIFVKKDIALDWIKGIPKVLKAAADYHIEQNGSEYAIEDYIEDSADDEFDIAVWVSDDQSGIEVEFKPAGKEAWRLNVEDCATMIRDIMLGAEALGWSYEEDVTDEEVSAVSSILKNYLED